MALTPLQAAPILLASNLSVTLYLRFESSGLSDQSANISSQCTFIGLCVLFQCLQFGFSYKYSKHCFSFLLFSLGCFHVIMVAL
jgi:hypothetical protein